MREGDIKVLILNVDVIFRCHCRVKFPKEVKWLCLEFDPRSCTAQTEDSLQLYIPNYRDFSDDDNKHITTPYIPVLKKFSNDPVEWPFAAVMLPGILYFDLKFKISSCQYE